MRFHEIRTFSNRRQFILVYLKINLTFLANKLFVVLFCWNLSVGKISLKNLKLWEILNSIILNAKIFFVFDRAENREIGNRI